MQLQQPMLVPEGMFSLQALSLHCHYNVTLYFTLFYITITITIALLIRLIVSCSSDNSRRATELQSVQTRLTGSPPFCQQIPLFLPPLVPLYLREQQVVYCWTRCAICWRKKELCAGLVEMTARKYVSCALNGLNLNATVRTKL